MTMSETLVGVTGIAALFFFLFVRMPVGLSLLVVGFGGIWYLDGMRAAVATMSSETFSSVTGYGLSVIPLIRIDGKCRRCRRILQTTCMKLPMLGLPD